MLPIGNQNNTPVDRKIIISPEQMSHLESLINTQKDTWLKMVRESNNNFIYFKSKSIQSLNAIQVFKDGRIWIHTQVIVGKGTKKKVKLIIDWDTKKKYTKSAVQKNYRRIKDVNENIAHEVSIYKQLEGKRGIVPLVDSFDLPSKSSLDGKKKVIIQELYTGDLEIMQIGWTAQDVKVIALDLLYALKAFRNSNMLETDFTPKNVLVLCDENRRALRAGFIDFDGMIILDEEQISNMHKRTFYELQNEITSLITKLYWKNNLGTKETSDGINEALSKGTYYIERIPMDLDEMIKKFES